MFTDSEMWRIIEGMNWIVECKNKRGYSTMKEKFMKKYSKTEAEQVRDFASIKRRKLYNIVDGYTMEGGGRVGNYGGDDSFGDMLDHVVGLGEKYYNAVTANPKLLNKLHYKENFAYGIPYDYDYDDA